MEDHDEGYEKPKVTLEELWELHEEAKVAYLQEQSPETLRDAQEAYYNLTAYLKQ